MVGFMFVQVPKPADPAITLFLKKLFNHFNHALVPLNACSIAVIKCRSQAGYSDKDVNGIDAAALTRNPQTVFRI